MIQPDADTLNPSPEPQGSGPPEAAPWARVLAALRIRPLYDHQPVWDELLRYRVELALHLASEGLELLVDSREGFACLKQNPLDETGRTVGLIQRRALSYELSLVCILLREWLEEFDVSASESRQLYITHTQLQSRMQLMFPERHNYMKLLRELDRLIKQTVDLGFLEPIRREGQEEHFQVMRIIKARVSYQELEAFHIQQEAYAQSLEPESR